MIGLEARERTGRGQYVETVMLTSMAYAVSEWGVSWDGKRDRTIDRGMHGFHALHRLYPTADGWLYLECHREDELRALGTAVGQPWLVDDPGIARCSRPTWCSTSRAARPAPSSPTRSARSSRRDRPTTGSANSRLRACPPFVPTRTSHHDFMLLSEQARANDVAVETTQPGLPRFWRAGPAIRFGEHPTPLEPSDALGEHTAAILHELGLSDGEIADLDERGVTRAKGNDLPGLTSRFGEQPGPERPSTEREGNNDNTGDDRSRGQWCDDQRAQSACAVDPRRDRGRRRSDVSMRARRSCTSTTRRCD